VNTFSPFIQQRHDGEVGNLDTFHPLFLTIRRRRTNTLNWFSISFYKYFRTAELNILCGFGTSLVLGLGWNSEFWVHWLVEWTGR
jgi:hypothetical protein